MGVIFQTNSEFDHSILRLRGEIGNYSFQSLFADSDDGLAAYTDFVCITVGDFSIYAEVAEVSNYGYLLSFAYFFTYLVLNEGEGCVAG